MKILFSPSEGKTLLETSSPITEKSFIFENLYPKRVEVIEKYDTFIQNHDEEGFGTDKRSIFERKTCKAILRYDGVAYNYLDYQSLDEGAKTYIDQNVIIFSNLFGPLLASDQIPHYTFKQGKKLPDFALEKYYKTYFSGALESFLDDEVLDLRAKHYEKFYKPHTSVTFKFIKEGKVVSHYAKAYRGKLLQEIATKRLSSLDQLIKHPFEDLSILEIQEKRGQKEIICDIKP